MIFLMIFFMNCRTNDGRTHERRTNDGRTHERRTNDGRTNERRTNDKRCLVNTWCIAKSEGF